MKKLTTEQLKKKIYEVHGDVVSIDETTYLSSGKKCRFIDKDYGEWFAQPSNVIGNKTSHPLRREEKIKKTCVERYGVDHQMKCKRIQQKVVNTCLEKYGIDNIAKLDEVKQKTKQTNFERYGIDYLLRDIEKRKKQVRKKYNVDNVMHHNEIARKCSKSNSKTVIKHHWKTNEELICQGSWEIKVVNWLNEQKIDFDWQLTFKIPENLEDKRIAGHNYTIDFYIKSYDLYVEIKGGFYKKEHHKFDISKLKWDWFHIEHPNSELWMKKELKEKGILK